MGVSPVQNQESSTAANTDNISDINDINDINESLVTAQLATVTHNIRNATDPQHKHTMLEQKLQLLNSKHSEFFVVIGMEDPNNPVHRYDRVYKSEGVAHGCGETAFPNGNYQVIPYVLNVDNDANVIENM